MSDFQQDFFDDSKPCPEEIHNCESLRTQYKEEIQKLEASGACSGCILRSLKQKYLTFILSCMQK